MPSVFTLEGSRRKSRKSLGAVAQRGDCKKVHNPKTKQCRLLCFVGKSAKARSGWQFRKGGC